MSDHEALRNAVIKGDSRGAVAETEKLLDGGTAVQEIVDEGLVAAMDTVGERFSKGKLFVPHMLRSARTMQGCLNLLKPHFEAGAVVSKGTVVIGTVKGDLHDIGKNLVAMMLQGAGMTVRDLGVDVAPEAFVEEVKQSDADLLAMSALLSTTMPTMKATIEALGAAGLRDGVKVMVGGAPVTEDYAENVGADGFGTDAASAVAEAKRLIGG